MMEGCAGVFPGSGPMYYVEVARGKEVVASGMGDNLVDALLGVIEFMLPPDHPDYPKD
jgi:hypothetical protein